MGLLKRKVTGKMETGGFTLVESLAGVLIITLFVAVSMQSFMVANQFKIKAKQISEADAWVNQDLEGVKALAADTIQIPYTSTELLEDVEAGESVIKINVTSGFVVGDSIVVGSDSNSNVIDDIQLQTDATTGADYLEITLVDELSTSQFAGNSAIVFARCRADVATGGFAAYLREQLPAVESETDNAVDPNTGTKTIAGKVYTIQRTPTIKPDEPYQVLELRYSVAANSESPILEVNSEVIPNAFFSCP
jgi:type II secretory pathway pseudopilin PulG